jgi:ATP-dependent DNA helicase RecG
MCTATMQSSETTTVPSASLDELDLGAFDAFVREHAPTLAHDEVTREDAMLRLRVAATMGSRLVPTVAGLYLFGEQPQWLMPQLGVVAVRIAGFDIAGDVVSRADLTGPLPQLVDDALAFVEREGRRIVNQVDPDDSELEFPLEAVREGVVNALVHRDLRAGGPVALRLFEDRLEIWNPGSANGLPNDLGHYMKRGGVSLSRNPMLAVFARQLGYAEQLGRGLPLIRDVVVEAVQGTANIESSKEGVLLTIPSGLHAHDASRPQTRN